MTLRIVLTDGNGVQGLVGTFGAFIQTNIVQTAADAAAAAASANAAANSSSSAAGSATAAASSASAASGSASAAAGSATSAATQAGNAATSATAAANSATSASGSASAASTSATNASNSATAAASSATAAANSATSAAGSASSAAATLANALTKANNLSDVASASTSRTNLGLGSAATQNTGTSGANVPLLNGANTWSAAQTFAGAGASSFATRPTFNGATPWDSANMPLLAGRNRISNGEALIAQRPSVGFAAPTGGYSGPDRFAVAFAATPGGTCTQSQGTLTYLGSSCKTIHQAATAAATSLSASNMWQGIVTQLEGANCYDFAQKQLSLQFVFEASIAGTYSFAIRDSTAAYSYVQNFTVAAANTPTLYTFNIPAPPAGASFPNTNAAGAYFNVGACNTGTYMCPTANLGTWVNANYQVGQGSTSWCSTLNATIDCTLIQLEVGSICTTFEKKTYEQYLSDCQRNYVSARTVLSAGYATGAGAGAYATFGLPVPMRVSGTVAQTGSSNSNLTAPTYSIANSDFSAVLISSTASATGAWSLNVQFTVSADF